ncbi:MAG: metal ABC transporter substrate-binding protein [Bacteroidales bacterium]|nr:metal ABC transporter substrate-binding protein [Clostridium sp.]MCM1203938.1 metal ABC transporter substrate-binding protein [Bacteroidales bacterium]
MKNNFLLSLFFLVFLAGTAGMTTACGQAGAGQRGFVEEDKLSVVTTIYPMYDFAGKIAGDKAEIINLVPAGMEPHDFELSTGDMQLVERADMFIYNGAGMEHFVDKTLEAVSNKNLAVVECARNIELVEASTEEGKTEKDPHTWLSPVNAIAEAEVIMEALVGLDKENEAYYRKNFEQYREQLEELDARYRKELDGLAGDTIVVAHEAFGYLCAEYGLKQEALEGLTPDSEPDAARMKEIIDFCREKDIRTIFFEELVSPKVAQTIAEEAGADTEVLNPLEGITAKQQEAGLDYIGLMEQNLEALKKALK